MNKRELLETIFRAGLAAVAPDQALRSKLRFAGDEILVDGQPFWNAGQGNLYVAGAGKGAAPMADALEHILDQRVKEGFVAVKYGHDLPLRKIRIAQAAHPVPDEAGLAAAARILKLASQCRPSDLLVCLFTGGASALTPAPAKGLSLSDMAGATRLLLACGADIREINALRKHLSTFSGGQLARAANGAKVLSLIVSDVIGDDPGAIASGPTAPDESTFAQCLEIVDKYQLAGKLPVNVLARLKAGAAGAIPETPKTGDRLFENVANIIVASNVNALEASAAKAGELGFHPQILTSALDGEARVAAAWFMDKARQIQRRPSALPACLLAGGETTVTVKGNGKGGRNQEMALAASIEIASEQCVSALFAGTDGTDGPSDAAGGFAFADTVDRIGGAEKAGEFLARNDSYHALKLAGDLLLTGPTRTNVMDISIALVGGGNQLGE